ncbi:NAC domain-containing protein 74-like [Phalaenopsis equestris]|uniref:NAC domain-containing protein 74-like n=1 Tax=Phalaenopsis equestris TaxID=78828 RepID=UPI0009E5CDFD|nr:NAC domain-containing protein 74-like [Phalaenopsis equestris]
MEALKAISLPPGFGFHPTDVELISHYLRRKNRGLKIDFDVIPELDIYKREPWDLPACCQIPTMDSKWHFFTSHDKKYPNGLRSNRATEAGYWKSTGKDRNIRSHNQVIGTKKTLVFHEGRPPRGKRTDWIMHEYYMDEKESKTSSQIKDTYVLCRITKRNGFAVGENVSTQTEEAVYFQNTAKHSYASLQESVAQDESSLSESTENLDAWFEELFDPDFDGSICFNPSLPTIVSKNVPQVSQTGLVSLIPKDEPLDFGFPPEEIIEILHNDFTPMPKIKELAVLDHNATLSSANLSKIATDNLKMELSDLSESTKFTGIQIRERHGIPAVGTFQHRVKLQVQTSKMESRKTAYVSQTIKSAHVDYNISTNSKPHRRINLELEKKRVSMQDGIKGIFAVVRSFLCLTDGLDSFFLGVCMIGTAALIIYYLFHDFLLGSFPAIGL